LVVVVVGELGGAEELCVIVIRSILVVSRLVSGGFAIERIGGDTSSNSQVFCIVHGGAFLRTTRMDEHCSEALAIDLIIGKILTHEKHLVEVDNFNLVMVVVRKGTAILAVGSDTADFAMANASTTSLGGSLPSRQACLPRLEHRCNM
jgi:hypothetical protein